MKKALLFDLGGTVLQEQHYDIFNGFSKISNLLPVQADFTNFNHFLSERKKNLAEFDVLGWIQNQGISREQASKIEILLWENTVTLFPEKDVQEALQYLNMNHIRVAAISNAIFSSNCICHELQKHDLLKYFEFVISSADLQLRKPHPDIFLSALNRLNIAPEDAAYIGDSIEADVFGALSVGMEPIFYGKESKLKNAPNEIFHLASWNKFESSWNDLNRKT